VAISSPKKIRFELRDPDLVYAWDICNIYKEFWNFYNNTNMGVHSHPVLKYCRYYN
jgi:hypothetical protein